MRTVRLVMSLVILALLMALAPVSFAQDMGLGLSAEDQAALTAAVEATSAATSGQFNLALNATIVSDGETATIDLTGTGTWDAANSGQFSTLFTGSASDGGPSGTIPLDAEIRLTGGTLYVTSSLLGMPGMWISLSGDEMSQMSGSLPMNPMDLAGGDLSGMEGMEGMGSAMAALATLDPSQFVSQSRDGDRFSTVIDVTTMLSVPEIQSFIVQAMQQQDVDTDTEEAAQMLAMLPAAMQGSLVTVDQYVTGGMLTRVVLTVAFNVDTAIIMGETGDPASIALTLDVNLSGFNQSYPVAAPEQSTSLMDMLSGMLSGMFES